eukprot:TRINITY_DN6952_c1_g1_i1.p1 TRINITY_DN6952_c1_g1~~TRINITY_DN6952_c1_g1_i1.p1  ORF type:complete len:439 (+),score=167.44 TRINITY_DN6952_c1_g1_i1:58-1374(+)
MVFENWTPVQAGQLSSLFGSNVQEQQQSSPVVAEASSSEPELKLMDVNLEVEPEPARIPMDVDGPEDNDDDDDDDDDGKKKKKKKKSKKKAKKEIGDDEEEQKENAADKNWKKRDANRTIFMGNVPILAQTKEVRKLLQSLGIEKTSIDSIRFRSVPVTSVHKPRKLCIAHEDFNTAHRSSKNAYVVFTTDELAQRALELLEESRDKLVLSEKHLRFDLVGQGKAPRDNSKSVFLGNLPFDIEEEEIWEHFQNCGTIFDVRVIRDRMTNAGKGFAYIRFADKPSVKNALLFNDSELKGRKLRVKKALDDDKLKEEQQKRKDTIKRMEQKGSNNKKGAPAAGGAKKNGASGQKNNKKPYGQKKAAVQHKPAGGDGLGFQGIQAKKERSSKLSQIVLGALKRVKAANSTVANTKKKANAATSISGFKKKTGKPTKSKKFM